MKIFSKNFLAIAAICAGVSVATDSMAVSKISPALRVKTLESRLCVESRNRENIVGQSNALTANVMIGVSGDFDSDLLTAYDFEEDYRFGNIIFGRLPLEVVDAVSKLEGVKSMDIPQVEYANLNVTRSVTGVDDLHKGLDISMNDSQDLIPFTGKGVVIGVVDGGIDPHHIAFSDKADGTRKVMRYTRTQGSQENRSGKLVAHSYNSPEEIASAPADNGANGHGTHTAGIAAGGYMENQYYGIAPDAELLLTSMGDNLYTDEIAWGITNTLDYGAQVGKPTVVNLSLGSALGPHNGFNYATTLLEDKLLPGQIVCFAAGNDAAGRVSLQRDFSMAPRTLLTILSDNTGHPARNINSYLSSKDERTFEVALTLVDLNRHVEVWRSPALNTIIPEDAEPEFAMILMNTYTGECQWPELEYNFSGNLYFIAAHDSETNGFTEFALMSTLTDVKNYAIGLAVSSMDGADVLMTVDGVTTCFSGLETPGYTRGNGNNSISDNCTSPYVISVGAWTATDKWEDMEGHTHNVNTAYFGPAGDIGYYSSFGLMRDSSDAVLPHVVAPGTSIISSVSNAVPNDEVPAASVTDDNGVVHNWGPNTGTSMAAPAVTGVIALWLQADPTLTRDDILNVMEKTCIRDKGVEKSPEQTRFGKIDAYAGLKYILEKKSSVGVIDSDRPSGLMVRKSAGNIEGVMPFSTTGGIATLLSLDGGIKKQINFFGNSFSIAVDELPSGIYVLMADTPQGKATQKIIK